MKLKLVILLSIAIAASISFAACSGAEKSSKEVSTDGKAGGGKDEVYITNADFQPERPTVATTKSGMQLPKRVLDDNSQVDTVIDGLGNKIETRNFPEDSRLRMVIMRTSSKGHQEVTVYSRNGESKIVSGLGDRALTASGEELAGAAQFSSTKFVKPVTNFMKKGNSETQAPLQPASSSEFPKTQTPTYPAENAPAETTATQEKPSAEQSNPEEKN